MSDPSGAGLSGATLTVGSLTATSGADGSYTLTLDQPDGVLTVSAQGYADLTQTLDLQSASTTLDLTLQYSQYLVTGTVIDARGTPISGVHVSAGTLEAISTDVTGHYALPLTGPGGTLTFSGVGFRPSTQRLNLTAASTEIDITLQDAAIVPMTVGSSWVYTGGPSGDVTFSITGTEVNPDGASDGGVEVADFTLDMGSDSEAGQEYADPSGNLLWDSVTLANSAGVGATSCSPAFSQMAPATPQNGDFWTVTLSCDSGQATFQFSVSGPAALTVSGTDYPAVWQVHATGPNGYVEDRFYVVGTGFVRAQVPAGGGTTMTLDLDPSKTVIE